MEKELSDQTGDQPKTVQHPTHSHPLTETDGEFICDGCKIPGSGKRYRCGTCNHVMHDYCATCPPTLTSFFMHPQHALALSVRKPATTRQKRRWCDLCGESVEGIFYRCQTCDFDVHPLCTLLPHQVQNIIRHPTHSHPLTEVNGIGNVFMCNGCQRLGSGKRYRCDTCDYDMHDYCAMCPLTLTSFFMHPHHALGLSIPIPGATRQIGRVCDVCNESIERMFYKCEICDFDAHPQCTLFPQHMPHALHPEHPLVLSSSDPSPCAVCSDTCESLRYRCGLCGFDVHIKCMLSDCDSADETEPEQGVVVLPARRSRRRRMFKFVALLTLRVALTASGVPFFL